VLGAVAQTLGIAPSPSECASEALHRVLTGKRFLLVVDNFEHVLDAAVLVADLLAASPGLSVLVTSREPLDLTGEHRVMIEPLAFPNVSEDVTVAELEATDATALFLAAAHRRDGSFEATPANAQTIAWICARLEGLPLALELAAARTGALGVRALAERIDAAVSDLGAGPRDAPARQQTLRATIDWSYRLLDANQSQAFVRFATFAGGATLDAAKEITGASHETLEALVAKSLVTRRRQPDDSNRLVMLESIRQYAVELLGGQGDERERLRRRHADWFLALAQARRRSHIRAAALASTPGRRDRQSPSSSVVVRRP
jgi:predicted ATPase